VLDVGHLLQLFANCFQSVSASSGGKSVGGRGDDDDGRHLRGRLDEQPFLQMTPYLSVGDGAFTTQHLEGYPQVLCVYVLITQMITYMTTQMITNSYGRQQHNVP